jgi:hypothetical protein
LDRTGCDVGGQFSLIDPSYNMYRMRMVLSGCPVADGDYRGLALLEDDGDLVFIVASDQQALPLALRRPS